MAFRSEQFIEGGGVDILYHCTKELRGIVEHYDVSLTSLLKGGNAGKVGRS